MCLYPRLIRNKKYTANKKNGGVIPAVSDKRVLWVPVGCGKCMECVKQKGREWQVRLLEEVRHNKTGKFVTMTFSDESILELTKELDGLSGYNLDNAIATLATRRFLERCRKKYKKSIRHFLITELGHQGTENIHMHGILFTDKPMEEIRDLWGYGYMWIGTEEKGKPIQNYVTERTVNYITKYITKIDNDHKEYKPKVLTSAGIGKGYTERYDSETNKFKDVDTNEAYRTRTGHKMSLPIYYRNKIYTDDEREKLWLNRLDEQVRWVGGEKIDVSENDIAYWNAVEHYRQKNKRLGYGDDSKNWEQKRYENEQRRMKQKERIDRAEKRKEEKPSFGWGGLGEDKGETWG